MVQAIKLAFMKAISTTRSFQKSRTKKVMDISQHIEINPKIMMGKPVIKGTRIIVELLLEKLSSPRYP